MLYKHYIGLFSICVMVIAGCSPSSSESQADSTRKEAVPVQKEQSGTADTLTVDIDEDLSELDSLEQDLDDAELDEIVNDLDAINWE